MHLNFYFHNKKEYFNEIRGESEALFVIEDPDIIYIPRVTKKDSETPTKGCLYNHYKVVRSELRLACKLPKKAVPVVVDEHIKNGERHNLSFIVFNP